MMTTVVFADGGQHAEPHHHQQQQQPSYYYEQYVSPSTAPVSYTPREGLASSSDFALDDGFNTVTHDEFMAATEKPRLRRFMTPKELPFYGDPETLHGWVYVAPGPSKLQVALGNVRTSILGPYYEACLNGLGSAVRLFTSTLSNIQEPANEPVKYGMVGLGGLSGVFLSMTRSLQSKITLPIAGALGMAAFLFPEKIPEVEDKIMAQVQENGAWAYWLLKNSYCDVVEGADNGGHRTKLFDGSMNRDLFSNASSPGINGNAPSQEPCEAPMSMLVTMLPPPPAITTTAVPRKPRLHHPYDEPSMLRSLPDSGST
jgi:hypothetical protein